ncbi:hypothetical protein LZ023_23110 [Pseudomonas silvicola]|nr:hypothetical protein LZ023_23110 [Pseudomonas silvicola]
MDKINTELFDPIVEPVGEKAHRMVRIVLSSIPTIGSAINETFVSILESPLSKRRNEWMHAVSLAINNLIEAQKISLESLHSNEEFIDVLIQATLIAQKTSQKAKLNALRNVVCNTTKNTPRPVTKSAHFLRLLDSLDEWHLKTLDFYRDANQYCDHSKPEYQKVSGIKLVMKAFPDLASEESYVTSVWYELKHAGLLTPNTPGEISLVPSGEARPLSSFGCMVTPLALEFLSFIDDKESSPLAENSPSYGVRVLG